MKDAYSFDIDDAGLAASYRLLREAYIRIFDRLGIDYRIVQADSGAMGGSASQEFLALAAAGEDTFAHCASCGYAANIEAVTTVLESAPDVQHPPLEELDTPDTPTIETLAEYLGVPASATLKNLLVKIDGSITAVGVPGDREVDLDRLAAAVAPATVELVTAEDFVGRPDLVRGYLGPQGLAGPSLRYLADPRVAPGTAWITGANQPGRHARHVVCGRDFTVHRYLDVATVLPGDPCPGCGAGLNLDRAIEIGHIFSLGRAYTDAFDVDVLGPEGKPVRVTMGSYGIGVSRAVATLAEQTHDSLGLCWPSQVAPADVHIVAAGRTEQIETAMGLAERLDRAGVRVLVDDRTAVSAGVKFADAELIGVPTILIVGRRAAEGLVELRDRRTGERQELDVESALAALRPELAHPRVGGRTATGAGQPS